MTPAGRAEVETQGGELLGYLPDNAFKVRMTPGQARQVDALSAVAWVGLFQPAYKMSSGLERGDRARYRVLLERGARAQAVVADIAATGAEVAQRGKRIVLVWATPVQLDAVARVLDVAWIENWSLKELHNEYAAGFIMGANPVQGDPLRGYDGAGQTVAITDSGIGTGKNPNRPRDKAGPFDPHVDLHDRIAEIYDWPGSDDPGCYFAEPDGPQDVSSGHGTHVAGSAVGEGDGAGRARSAAPGASLVFQAIEDFAHIDWSCALAGLTDEWYLIGLPEDLTEIFDQSYGAGARIHSNSWGDPSVPGDYTIDSANADAFVWNNPQLAILFSAGNSGRDTDCDFCPGDGEVNPGSISPPATAKNVITVGASENDRDGDYACDPIHDGVFETNEGPIGTSVCAAADPQNSIFTYGEAALFSFPASPLVDDPSAGNREQMAAFSSRGPTNDGRIKPDVVAPGTWILSTYSDMYQTYYDAEGNDPCKGCSNIFWQTLGWGVPRSDLHKSFGGTSMAAPIVACGAAVVRQYFNDFHGHASPSAALVKATLINTAVDLLDENNDGVDDNFYPIPNIHEGWGRVDLNAATGGGLQYVDNTTGIATGQTSGYLYAVDGDSDAFKATLTWSDYPATSGAIDILVNDLDLRVIAPDGTTVYLGNDFAGGWSQAGGAGADQVNTVESVYVQSAGAGTWTVEVTGTNVPQGPQPFALIVDVSGGGGDAPPTASIASPAAGGTVAGNVTIQVDASDAEATAGSLTVEVAIDSGSWLSAAYDETSERYQRAWDTTQESEGGHIIHARVSDGVNPVQTAGNDPLSVTVDNLPADAPPTASLISPADGSTVSGTVAVQVDAADGEDPAGTLAVEVSTDGGASWAGAVSTTGTLYAYSWPTPAGEDRVDHTIVARATDSATNVTTSASLTVAVDNVAGGPDDPQWNQVELLLHMDGPDQSTVFIDSSGRARAVTAVGNSQIDTANSKFGGASGKLDGGGDYLTLAGGATTPWDLPGDFTLEGWMDADAAAGGDGVLTRGSSSTGRWVVYINPDGTLSLYVNGVASGALITSTSDLRGAGWLHWAVTRSGNTWRLFVGGVQEASATIAGTIGSSTATLYVGTDPVNLSSRAFPGHLDDVRITVGTARYTANFTPTSAGLTASLVSPASGSTVSGTVAVQVAADDGEDPAGTLTVEVSSDGGTSWSPAAPIAGSLYEYAWPTPDAEDGVDHTLLARATDSAANTAVSGSIIVTVDNVDDGTGDPQWSQVELLLHMDGPDQSTAFIDSSSRAHAVSAAGNSQIDTANSVLGGASGLFDGTGDYLTVPGGASAPWDLPGDFTLEGWMDADAAAGGDGVLTRGSSSTGRWVVYINPDGTLSLYVNGVASGALITSTSDVRGAGWLHWAVTRSGDVWRLFIGGVQEASATTAGTIAGSTAALYVGTDPVSLSSRAFLGHLDEIRITVGTARYTTNFTPPGAGLTASLVSPANGSTVSGTVAVQVNASDGEDPAGTLIVEVSTDGGASWSPAAPLSGNLYEYPWSTPTNEDRVGHTLLARATDSDANTELSGSIVVTVDNVDDGTGDPQWSQVELLLHMDGPDQSTAFIDSSSRAHAVSAAGNSQIDTANSVLGGASGKFDGSSDYLSVAGGSASSWDLPGDFTLEGWMDADAAAGSDGVLSRGSSGNGRWVVYVNPDGTLALYVTGVASGALLASTTDVRGAGWLHWAVTRSGNIWRLFIGGVEEASMTNAGTIASSTNSLYVGTDPQNLSSRSFKGHLDDVRITVGTARYVANFTPTSAGLTASIVSPSGGSTVSGTVSVQVAADDGEDPAGTLAVEVSTDGGATWAPATPLSGNLYEYAWQTPEDEDRVDHTIVARATDSAANIAVSGAVIVTVDNVDEGASDPQWSQVELFLHMDGPDQSTDFIDSSSRAHSVSAAGNAMIVTANSKFGGASGKFDGSSDYLSVAGGSASSWDLPGDFTLEGWMDADATASSDGVLGRSKRGNARWVVYVNPDGTLALYVTGVASGALLASTTDVRGAGWLHWAVTRSGNIWRLFIGGVEEASMTNAGTIASSTNSLYVGTDPQNRSSRSFKGHLDEVRITVGAARYTVDFTPAAMGLTASLGATLADRRAWRQAQGKSP